MLTARFEDTVDFFRQCIISLKKANRWQLNCNVLTCMCFSMRHASCVSITPRIVHYLHIAILKMVMETPHEKKAKNFNFA